MPMISNQEAMLLGYEQYRRELDLKIAGIRQLITGSAPVSKRRTSQAGRGRVASATKERWQEAKRLAAHLGEPTPRTLGDLPRLRELTARLKFKSRRG